MFQNIKVDIIYYKVQTDFEMEFNLSGCCRMRLLTGKAPDRKILVNQLVRAVSRSRIIIMTGALFGKSGIIETCAKAIGRETETVDNQRFGIRSEDGIDVISNSIPLVSTDGIFGGCIVEQGPQTLILLTDNRNVRKNVMQNLIHPYIKDVCASEMTEKEPEIPNSVEKIEPTVVLPPVVEASMQPDAELILPEIEPDLEIEIPDTENQTVLQEEASAETEQEDLPEEPQELLEEDNINPEIEFEDNELIFDDLVMDEESDSEDPMDFSNDIVIDEDEIYVERGTSGKMQGMDFENINGQELIFDEEPEFFDLTAMSEDFKDFVIDEDDDENGIPIFPNRGINIPILIVSIVLLGLVAVLCYCIFFVPAKQDVGVTEYLKEVFDTLFV